MSTCGLQDPAPQGKRGPSASVPTWTGGGPTLTTADRLVEVGLSISRPAGSQLAFHTDAQRA